ncbi:MAG: phenylalanine--tRNA ligase subunit alpha, partial [Candidatus Micrarchaeota archaeon]|nr:phenylalanine--tRNA ligase subunit alpha [Candidatus Micrarchaeota archaeon]
VYFDSLGKWVEVGGAGLLRPEVLEPLKIRKPVIAWGLGFTRLAMFALGIDDIRNLFSENLNWLRRKEVYAGNRG